MRRYVAQLGRKFFVLDLVDRTVLHRQCSRIFAEIVACFPFACRSHRPRGKSATAIGTHIVQHMVDTTCAERALIRTDARFGRFGRQRLVAVLAGGAQFEHALRELTGVTGQV